MTITIHRDLDQGSEDWFRARCGLLTASEMRLAAFDSPADDFPDVVTREDAA